MAPNFFKRCCQTAKFPKSVFFVLGNELCERFSYYGMRAVLTIYLTQELLLDRPSAKVVFHTFTMLNYFTPLFGGLLADIYLGKFKTIFFVSLIYSSGNVLLSLTTVPQLNIYPKLPFIIISLLIIAIGSGGIKPCVSAFGGDQFDKNQEEMRDKYFSIFYFCINVGAAMSMILSPIFRADVHCLGMHQCYPLAFGFPAVLMIIATIIFFLGRPLYKIYPPQGNAVVDFARCIMHAVRNRFRATEKRSHWLDYADDKFDPPFIDEVKIVFSILLLFAPLPMFWALFDQQGSTWTLQSARMDGRLGDTGFEIKPDQMDSLNAILVILFIPIFSFLLYPLLAKRNLLTTPLQKMCTGGFVTAISFVLGGCIQVYIERYLPTTPAPGTTDLTVINTLNCSINVQLQDHTRPLENYEYHTFTEILLTKPVAVKVSLTTECVEAEVQRPEWEEFEIKAESEVAYSVCIFLDGGNLTAEQAQQYKTRDKQGKSFVRFVSQDRVSGYNLLLHQRDKTHIVPFEKNGSISNYCAVWSIIPCKICWARPSETECVEDETMATFSVYKGGTFDVLLLKDETKNVTDIKLIETVPVDSVQILYQIPQYMLITSGEVMLSITGLSFAYSQAPPGMKSVLQAAWLMTVALGNVLVVIIEQIKLALSVERESISFFMYSILMALDMCIFTYLAYRYKYKTP